MLLVVAAVGILRLVHRDVAEVLERWIVRLGFDPDSPLINRILERVTNISPQRFRELGIGAFLYSGLFLTEGIGLWMLKRWAEWFTVIATGSLIPIEIYEIMRRPNLIKTGVLLLNIAIVVYLIWQIKRDRRQP